MNGPDKRIEMDPLCLNVGTHVSQKWDEFRPISRP